MRMLINKYLLLCSIYINKNGQIVLDNIRILEHRILKELAHKNKRYLYATVDFSSQMIGIVGARGVDKTTMLLQYTNP